MEVKVPLVLVPPTGMAISELPPSEVLVKVKGSRAFVRNLFNDNEKVFINLKRRGSLTRIRTKDTTFKVSGDNHFTMREIRFGVLTLENMI